jgi:ABC-2 type transport system permease protein
VVVVTVIIAATAPLLVDGQAPTDWPGFVLVFLATNIASAGLGVLIAVIATDARSTVLLPQLIFLPSMLLGGLMMPASVLPGALARISRLLPAMNATNAFAGLAMGGEVTYSPWGSVVVLLAGGLVAFLLATVLFTWDSRNQGRRRSRIWALLALVPYLVGMIVL